MSMVYKWRPGFQYAGKANAAKVAKELNGGDITTEAAWDIAKRDTSELHKCVTWDRGRAAKAYQLQEIRNALNHIVVVTVVKNKQGEKSEVLMPYVESVKSKDTERRYMLAHDLEGDDLNYVIAAKERIIASIAVELAVYRGRRKSMGAAISKLEEAKTFMLRAETEKDTKGKPKARHALMAAVVN